jgi:hypothetical protein
MWSCVQGTKKVPLKEKWVPRRSKCYARRSKAGAAPCLNYWKRTYRRQVIGNLTLHGWSGDALGYLPAGAN